MKKKFIVFSFVFYSCIAINVIGCGGSTFTSEEKKEIQRFKKSIQLWQEAKEVLYVANKDKPVGTISTISESTLKDYVGRLSKALQEAQMVSADLLAKIHPDLPLNYYSLYVECLKQQIRGFSNHAPMSQLMGQMLEAKWIDWYDQHYKEFESA
jgi:hypothetical protein